MQAKTNRENGSYATADLFERHPKIKNAWFYHSRADSQLTLITGKKFDPAPLEAAIATSEHLDDVLIFGDGQPYPGALLLRSEKSSESSDTDLVRTIWPQVERMNKESQDHARIPEHMLIPIKHQEEPLEKSSKGTIIRKAAEARFAKYIEFAYGNKEEQDFDDLRDEELPQYLTKLVQSMIQSPEPPAEDTDLFAYGVDSIACMRLRSHIRRLTPNYTKELPLSVVEDCGTIRDLSKYVIRKRHGEADAKVDDENQMMLDLVETYGDFSSYSSNCKPAVKCHEKNGNTGEVVLLTGATGALGAHILSLLRSSPSISAIYCLVRGADAAAAHGRVSKALSQRGLPDLSSLTPENAKVTILQAQLSSPQLGLSDSDYHRLASTVTSILHIAWTVNFRLKLRSFEKDNIAGVRHLLDLALAQDDRIEPPRFTYCSSTAAVINAQPDNQGHIPESLSPDPASASPLGYSRSKWVAEHICLAAQRDTRLKGRIAVVRVGQLAGDSQTGIWNASEAWPLLLSTAELIGCLPNLGDEPLDWLPVDVAAKAFVQASQVDGAESGKTGSTNGHGDRDDQAATLPVFHILNPHSTPTWRTALSWLLEKKAFDIVPPAAWVAKLAACDSDAHSSLKLLGLWTEAYGDDGQKMSLKRKAGSEGVEGSDGVSSEEATGKKFSVRETERAVEVMRGVRPLDEEYLGRVWEWVMREVK